MHAARLSLAALLFGLGFGLSFSPPAFADTPVQLVPAASGYKTMSTTVDTKGAAITTAEFAAVILDGDHYPMTASYMGVKALLECRSVEKRSDGSVAVYQRTGSGMGISSRQYVILLKVVSQTDTAVEIQWELVQHSINDKTYSGPFAAALNAHQDAVYTPYNRGGWKYDKTAGKITYYVTSDPGGSVPGFMQTQGAVTAFPLELLRVKWGVTPD